MAGTILVTGFVPFAHHERNISQQVVESISSNAGLDCKINTSILTVDEKGSREISGRIQSGEEISAVLHLGFSENAEELLIEKFARNRFQMKIADNSLRMETTGKIASGKITLQTNVPINIIDDHLEGIPEIRWNEDAGGFVCNETYYRSLLAASARKSPIVLFIHLPSEDKISLVRQTEIICNVCNALGSVSDL